MISQRLAEDRLLDGIYCAAPIDLDQEGDNYLTKNLFNMNR